MVLFCGCASQQAPPPVAYNCTTIPPSAYSPPPAPEEQPSCLAMAGLMCAAGMAFIFGIGSPP
jgi:hypothetical protein